MTTPTPHDWAQKRALETEASQRARDYFERDPFYNRLRDVALEFDLDTALHALIEMSIRAVTRPESFRRNLRNDARTLAKQSGPNHWSARVAAADAASGVWEPVVVELLETLETFGLDDAPSVVRRRWHQLKEMLDGDS